MQQTETTLFSLIQWIGTFPNLSRPVRTPADFADGVVLFDLLNQLDSKHFDLKDVQRDTKDNLILKVGNLKRLANCLQAFFSENDNPHKAIDISYLNTMMIAKSNPEHLYQLLELVILCAVKSPNNEQAITNIMGLEESVQVNLANIISDVQNRLYGEPVDLLNASCASISPQDPTSPVRRKLFDLGLTPSRSPPASTSPTANMSVAFADIPTSPLQSKQVIELKRENDELNKTVSGAFLLLCLSFYLPIFQPNNSK